MFTHSEVTVLTHTNPSTYKQIPAKISNVLCYATTLGKNFLHAMRPGSTFWYGEATAFVSRQN